jgi:hypothetical protein
MNKTLLTFFLGALLFTNLSINAQVRRFDIAITDILDIKPMDTFEQNEKFYPFRFVVTNLGPDTFYAFDIIGFRVWVGSGSFIGGDKMVRRDLGVNDSDTFSTVFETYSGFYINDIDLCVTYEYYKNNRGDSVAKPTPAMEKNDKFCIPTVYYSQYAPRPIDTITPSDSVLRFAIYPNPANKELFVQLGDEFSEDVVCRLFSKEGKEIMLTKTKIREGVLSLDIFNIESGVYILQLNNGENIKREKIIIQP